MDGYFDSPQGNYFLPEAGGDSVRIECIRPSLLDPFLPNEPGFGPCGCAPNVVVLFVVNHPVAIIQATSMDQVSLDSWLARVRSRSPRAPAEC
jgi:hypothetical protein